METLEKKSKKSIFFKIILFFFKILLLGVLPFILLIRVSVLLNASYGFNIWIALFGALFITAILLVIYFAVLYKVVFDKKVSWKSLKIKLLIVIFLLGGFCGYTLFYISKQNTKTTEVQNEYSSIHPILRMSVSTILILDNSLLITDLSRTHSDYKKMGLKTLKNSLHYKQADNYVHAMDLRTVGRSEVRNFLLKLYFDAMGFNTLRHNGTADHLHISLPLFGKPRVI